MVFAVIITEIVIKDFGISLTNPHIGGPFGVEPSLKAAGNLYAIIGFAVMPFLWALPEAIMTYELSVLHPCASGGVLWVRLFRFLLCANRSRRVRNNLIIVAF